MLSKFVEKRVTENQWNFTDSSLANMKSKDFNDWEIKKISRDFKGVEVNIG